MNIRNSPPLRRRGVHCTGVLVMGAALVGAGCTRSVGAPDIAVSDGDHAFVGAHVLPMDGRGPLADQTVIVRDGRIVRVASSATTPVPDDVTVIDARGRYLIPGLSEMHAHIPTEDPTRDDLEELMFLYLANGITTLRGMQGAPDHVDLAGELAEGRLLGPTLYTASPALSGETAPDPETAEALVREYARTGYHLIKTYPGLSRETWNRMAETSTEVGLSFAGHVPVDVGVYHALSTGMSCIDHLDGFVETLLGDGYRDELLQGVQPPAADLEAAIAPGRVTALANDLVSAGVWIVPTMQLWEYFFNAADPDSLVGLAEMRYVSPRQRRSWHAMRVSRPDRPEGVGEAVMEGRRRLLRALYEAGAPFLLGTDSPQMFNVPGFALHREIRIYEEVGIEPWDILAAGSSNVARYVEEVLGRDADFGTVAIGNRADLVLLSGNPLDDLGHLERPAGVMVRGRWISGDAIEDGLAQLARRYAEP